MRQYDSLFNKFLHFLTCTLILSTNACASTSSWKEEALLHDGTTVVVTRTATRGGGHEIGQQPSFSSQTLTFVNPYTNETVTWEDNFSKDIGGANFLPIMLAVDGDITYVVSQPLGCKSYNNWGRPNPPYIVFKYQKAWTQISLSELPEALSDPNLIESSPDITAAKTAQAVVSARTIKAIRAKYPYDFSKKIIREPIQKSGGILSCRTLVKYKCGWGDPGEFNQRYFDENCK